MKKIIAVIMMFTMVFTMCAPSVAHAGSAESNPAVESKLNALIKKYDGTYWTTNGRPSDRNGSTSLRYPKGMAI